MTKAVLYILFFIVAYPVCAAEFRIQRASSALSAIIIEGEILAGDAERFEKTIKNVDAGLVLLKSPGGLLLEGLKIGRVIKSAGYNTGVPPFTACASACALAWLGGETRYMAPTALVGFHAAYVVENGVASESSVGNALVGAYLNELGLGLNAIIFASSAAPNEMNWLNAAKAQKVGINVIFLSTDGSSETETQGIKLKLPTGFRWIVLESARSSSSLRTAKVADNIVKTQNGYFAAIIGPYEKLVARRILSDNPLLPNDAYLSSGNGFLFSLFD